VKPLEPSLGGMKTMPTDYQSVYIAGCKSDLDRTIRQAIRSRRREIIAKVICVPYLLRGVSHLQILPIQWRL